MSMHIEHGNKVIIVEGKSDKRKVKGLIREPVEMYVQMERLALRSWMN